MGSVGVLLCQGGGWRVGLEERVGLGLEIAPTPEVARTPKSRFLLCSGGSSSIPSAPWTLSAGCHRKRVLF